MYGLCYPPAKNSPYAYAKDKAKHLLWDWKILHIYILHIYLNISSLEREGSSDALQEGYNVAQIELPFW